MKGQEVVAYLTYTWRCIDRLFWALIAFPALAFFLVAAAAGGMSFDGVVRQFYELSAETPVVTTDPATFRVKVCADPKPAQTSTVPDVVEPCSKWEYQTQSLDELAGNGGRSLRFLYLFFVVLGIAAMALTRRLLPKWPEAPASS
ncbi:hypothetical protein V8I72_003656 [Escherichia coli]